MANLQHKGIDVHVTIDGMFQATLPNGQSVLAGTFEDIKKRISAAKSRKRIKLNLPLVIGQGDHLRRVILTGVHAATGHPMARFTMPGGKAFTEQFNRAYDVYREMSEAEFKEYERLLRAKKEASKSLEGYLIARRVSNHLGRYAEDLLKAEAAKQTEKDKK